MNTLIRPWSAVGACAATLLFAACAGAGGGAPGSFNPALQSAVPSVPSFITDRASTRPKVSPKRLNFTTTPTLKLIVTESKYKGKFKLKVFGRGIVKLSSKTVKGPRAKVTITALKAGQGSITITDENGRKTVVPVSVTQGVIVIQ
jgi:hypothetical protein